MNHALVVGFIACLFAPGCVVQTGDSGHVQTGSLVLDWTVDGTNNPDQCDLSNSTTLDITVSTDDGAFFGEYQQSCDAFATTVDLPPGHYDASAVLLDPNGHDRTTAVQTGGFTIYGNDELSIPVDFPASSFY